MQWQGPWLHVEIDVHTFTIPHCSFNCNSEPAAPSRTAPLDLDIGLAPATVAAHELASCSRWLQGG